MRNPITIVTHSDGYDDTYNGKYLKYYQVHVFSVPCMYSIYFDPVIYAVEEVKQNAKTLFAQIRVRSEINHGVTLFEKNGKFLITENPGLIEPAEMYVFDSENIKYEYITEEYSSFFNFIGETKADIFIKNALISVGAEDLYPLIEPFAMQFRQDHERRILEYPKMRQLDKTNPKFRIEIFKIAEGYVPVKVNEFLCYDPSSFYRLPEYTSIFRSDKRMTHKLIEISTNKIIENYINIAIRRLKRKKPSAFNLKTLSMSDLYQMGLVPYPNNIVIIDNSRTMIEEEDEDDESTPKI